MPNFSSPATCDPCSVLLQLNFPTILHHLDQDQDQDQALLQLNFPTMLHHLDQDQVLLQLFLPLFFFLVSETPWCEDAPRFPQLTTAPHSHFICPLLPLPHSTLLKQDFISAPLTLYPPLLPNDRRGSPGIHNRLSLW